MTRLNAAIFMPEEELRNAAMISRCLNHITAGGDRFDSIVSHWPQIKDMLRQETIQLVVYAQPDHINPLWLPRFELAVAGTAKFTADSILDEPPASALGRRHDRRPIVVKR